VKKKMHGITISPMDPKKGGVTGRPEIMCPRTNVLGRLVPKLIVPCDTMSLDCPCHYALYNKFRLVRNEGDVSLQGHSVSGTVHVGGRKTLDYCGP